MRAAVLLCVSLAACAPDIVPDSYFCGPNASCPEGQVCNGHDHHCVSPSNAEQFACASPFEPDNSAAEAHAIPQLDCVSAPFIDDNCMDKGDAEDWIKLTAPAACAAVQVQSRVTFPLAFQRLGFELWDLGTMTKLADDTECVTSGQGGEEIRCLTHVLVPGSSYGIKVHPAGDGNCDGDCSYNTYSLRLQLETP